MPLSKLQAIYQQSRPEGSRWTEAAPEAGARALNGRDSVREMTAAELYEQYLADVFRYVWQRVSSAEAAEDITAEVFAAAAAGLPRFRGQCSPYLWLLSIARRQVALAGRRRAARRETLASELAETGPDAAARWEALATVEGPEIALMRVERRRVLDELVADLNPDQREALMLQYMEDLSVAEIAAVMGRSAASVYSLQQRARATLYRRGKAYFLNEDEG
jgi:RNA polymerase sigma-70 factor (ECF subfamily)